jgi:ABC-type branched-subunit amino acid transport system substrate-binding protein
LLPLRAFAQETGGIPMRTSRHPWRRVTPLVLVVAVLAGAVAASAGSPAVAQVPGFDGSTVKVAGYGLAELPSVPIGARARIQEFNDESEIEGVTIDFSEYAIDKTDPATALSEVRRLVSQEQVFAIVPEVSLVTPGDYITQQKVPVFGSGFSSPYCSDKPTKSLWLFGYTGCQVTDKPTVTRDTEANVLKYVQEATGKKKPTVAQISEDNAVGQVANELFRAQFEGNPGWGKLVYNEAAVPPPPVGDVTPYVQALATADNGEAPDFIRCGAGTVCLNIYGQLRANGYEGEFEHNLYTDSLVKPFEGSIIALSHQNINNDTPAMNKMKESVEAVEPGTQIDSGVVYGYIQADMFIAALKEAAKGGKSNITRENVQKAAATGTWEIKGLAGPTKFPGSTVAPTPLCREIVKSDGTTWQTVVPFSCNTKSFKVKSG